ncbi:MAG: hypothetical protein AB199_02765 [Parcubacteria bacterium C7867-004]|nr:MAG: hypothetical protein AB199_02765 [Parcubacteria bacterium C7867-004]
MEREYAQALREMVAGGTDEAAIVDGLVKHLKLEGRLKLLPGILRELKGLQARAEAQAPRVEVASEEEAKDALTSAKEEGIDAREATINPSLIRGWRAQENGTLIDRSAKKALVDLYQKITN